MRWWLSWRHAARNGHWPEWVELGGLAACVRCVKGGHRSRNVWAARPI